jgi:hypothetical protein
MPAYSRDSDGNSAWTSRGYSRTARARRRARTLADTSAQGLHGAGRPRASGARLGRPLKPTVLSTARAG